MLILTARRDGPLHLVYWAGQYRRLPRTRFVALCQLVAARIATPPASVALPATVVSRLRKDLQRSPAAPTDTVAHPFVSIATEPGPRYVLAVPRDEIAVEKDLFDLVDDRVLTDACRAALERLPRSRI
jgi:hypothetical protein